MPYRLVYDVRNESPPWFGVLFACLLLLFAIACFLEILERVRGRQSSPTPPLPRSIEVLPFGVVAALGLLMGGLAVFFASCTSKAFVQQKHCQEWVRAGQYQVTAGKVTDYEYRKAGARFRLAGLSFDLLRRSAGFTGRFNAPGVEEGSLHEGLQVRLCHQEGLILRVEIVP